MEPVAGRRDEGTHPGRDPIAATQRGGGENPSFREVFRPC